MIRHLRGKIRRYTLNRFRRAYVEEQAMRRQGECSHCGNCCEILFRCPFLLTLEDGTSQCSIYEDRPGQCAAFPIDARDLADVDDCTFTFAPSDVPLVDIEPTAPEPIEASKRHNPKRTLPALLLHRILNKTR